MRRPVFLTKNEIERSRLGGHISNGAESVLRERERHLSHEGWTAKHDDGHRAGEIARAAACYALSAGPEKVSDLSLIHRLWPWEWRWFKPRSKREDLVRAGALIIAEIDRLDRADTYEICETCSGSGYSNHPDSGEVCNMCGGGGVVFTASELPLSVRLRAVRITAIEESAQILDEAERDWRRIRDPGMANNAASYAKKIRALCDTPPQGQPE